MADTSLTPELLSLVAERFKVLGEPARLGILNALRAGEQNVGELQEVTGLSQANLSKHLQLLYAQGFVERRRDGVFVRYQLANDDVFALCDLMCGRLQAEVRARSAVLGESET